MNLELKPNTGGDAACDALSEQASGAGNARSGDLLANYIKWTETAERMLSNHFTVETIDELIHTQRYWMLRVASGDPMRLNALVDAELADRQGLLQTHERKLRAERHRWRNKPATLTVVDTSIFLDPDRRIEAIDWLTITDSRPGVRLIAPLIVIHELDRLKRQGNQTASKRARDTIRWLAATLPRSPDGYSDLLSGDKQRGVTIEVAVHDGPARPADADGVIIDFTARLRTVSGMPTKLVTRDLGMQLRARSLDIEASLLDDADAPAVDRLLQS